MEKLSDDIILAQDIVQELIKAKKQLNLYPPNNPIYIKTVDEVLGKFKNYFDFYEELPLKIHQYEITLNGERIYENTQKEDNLALFFFKDGIKEITFTKGFTRNEFESFMKILNTDFENFALDDDVVTLLWEEDFEHIKYVVDETILFDDDVDEEKICAEVKDRLYSDDDLMRAYQDGLKAEVQQANKISQLNETDLKQIAQEIAKDESQTRIDKITFILLELLYQTKEKLFLSEIADFIGNSISYCIRGGDFKKASFIINSVKALIKDKTIGEEKIRALNRIFTAINSKPLAEEIGNVIDSMAVIDEDDLKAFIKHLDRPSIPFFMKMMEEMQSIKGKRLIIEILSIIGRLDINTIAKGLNNPEWNIVKNTITILSKIADTMAVEHLVKILSHPDPAVRKSAIKAMGDISGRNIIGHLKNSLSDRDLSVRAAAAKALGNTKSEGAKRVLLYELSKKQFSSKDLEEKKQFYEALTNWEDQEIRDFLINALRKKKFWRKTRNDETRACAAHAIAIIGDREAIPFLQEAQKTKNKLLQTHLVAALKRFGI
jgi:HEAT repeat protein